MLNYPLKSCSNYQVDFLEMHMLISLFTKRLLRTRVVQNHLNICKQLCGTKIQYLQFILHKISPIIILACFLMVTSSGWNSTLEVYFKITYPFKDNRCVSNVLNLELICGKNFSYTKWPSSWLEIISSDEAIQLLTPHIY